MWSDFKFEPNFSKTTTNVTHNCKLIESSIDHPLLRLSTPAVVEVVDTSINADLPSYLFDPLSDVLPTDETTIKPSPYDLIKSLKSFVNEGSTQHIDGIQLRLEELDETSPKPSDTSSGTMKLTEMKYEVSEAWERGDMVKALKVVIQSVKLLPSLSSTSPSSVPHMLLLITEVLDTFSDLVFQRIKSKAASLVKQINPSVKFPELFSCSDVPDMAKVIASNWIGKISSVRELLPRVMIEASAIKLYPFLISRDRLPRIFERLVKQVRGFSDPIASLFGRAYICRIAQEEFPDCAQSLSGLALNDLILTFNTSSVPINHEMTTFLIPLIECMCFGLKSGDVALFDFSRLFKKCLKNDLSLPIISTIFSSFPADHVIKDAPLVLSFIEKNISNFSFEYFTPIDAIQNVAKILSQISDTSLLPTDFGKFISRLWDVCCHDVDVEIGAIIGSKKIKVLSYLISSVCLLMIPINQSKAIKYLNTLLNQVISIYNSTIELSVESGANSSFTSLITAQQVAITECLELLINNSSLLIFFSVESFLSCLALLPVSLKSRVASSCLKNLDSNFDIVINDSVVTHGLLVICQSIVQSISMETSVEQRQSVSTLLSFLIHNVKLSDADSQLSFLSDCRSLFLYFDRLQEELVMLAINLVVDSSWQSKSTEEEFIMSVLAFIQVTIPAVSDLFSQLRLYVATLSLAVSRKLSRHCNELFSIIFDLIPQIPPFLDQSIEQSNAVSSSSFSISIVKELANLLLLIPEKEAIVYLEKLFEAVRCLHFSPTHATYTSLTDEDLIHHKREHFGTFVRQIISLLTGSVLLINSNSEHLLKIKELINQEIISICSSVDPYGQVSSETALILLDLINFSLIYLEADNQLISFLQFIYPIVERAKMWKSGYAKSTLNLLETRGVKI
ncbi:hypothetical protein RCL1_002072 [Eukaryota sp. TZLM3-RCL]